MMSQQIKHKLFYVLVATLVFIGCQSEVENPFLKGPYVQTLKQTEPSGSTGVVPSIRFTPSACVTEIDGPEC